jgi:hypothetical protein
VPPRGEASRRAKELHVSPFMGTDHRGRDDASRGRPDQKVRGARLEGQVTVLMRDYRDLHGAYDKLGIWTLYLAYCKVGFAERRICDVQLLLAKPHWAAKAAAKVHSAEIAATGWPRPGRPGPGPLTRARRGWSGG